MKKIIVILFFTSLVLQGFAQSREVSFTLDDRDRIMRTEEKLEALQLEMNVKIESLRNEMNAKFEAVESKMDAKFEAVDQRFESLEAKFDLIYWILGIIVVIMLFNLGYIIWDRRTASYPVQDKTRNLEEQVNKLMHVTREQAKKDPEFAEILKIAGLL